MTTEETFRLDLQGYFVRRAVFTADEVARIIEEMKKFEGLEKHEFPSPHAFGSWTPKVHEYRIQNLPECSDLFLNLIDHEGLYDVVEESLPSPHRITEAYSITRTSGMGIPLHFVDIAMSRRNGGRLLTNHLKVAIVLSDSLTTRDGPFVVIEGSHRIGRDFPFRLIDPEWTVDTDELQAYVQHEDQRVALAWKEIPGYREVYARAGDVIFFTEDLWHGAQTLETEHTRRTIYLGFSPYHFCNWHGLSNSEQLLERCSPRQRMLLSGPYIGYNYEDHVSSQKFCKDHFFLLPNERKKFSKD